MRLDASRKSACVLGVPLDLVDYDSAMHRSLELVATNRPIRIAAANTHLVALARHDREFGEILRNFDMILPDGMPLIWSLARQGHILADRVYGPYFMRYVLLHAPSTTRHYFFGGSQSTLEALEDAMRALRPELLVVGRESPPFRQWNESDESQFAEAINRASPDFIWVCLGGEKQERWITKNLHRFERGALVGVGDAFALLAGERSLAPAWMQRSGLTWLFRLIQEPGRLIKRYLKYNTLFIWYSLLDSKSRNQRNT